jgi:ATPase
MLNTYESIIDKFFTPDTMSLHLKAWTTILSKRGKPWQWEMIESDNVISQVEIQEIVTLILWEVISRDDSLIEIDRTYSKVIQMWLYRIVIVLPPLSDDYEITIVRPITRLWFNDYNLDIWLIDLLEHSSQWILVCWAPWSWKTTFAQALTDKYVEMKKIVKTIEAPRDLVVSDSVVQYSFHYWTHDEVRDILLLSRPDFTVYDEIRNTSDFVLYKDLRLTGIWLIGVMHATHAIDSIQRFIGVVSLGMIPQIIDTVLFIQWGVVHTIYTLSFTVRTPSGMLSDDLARPIVEVKDFRTWQLMYELYSFGEQIVVMPLDKLWSQKNQSWTLQLAELYLKNHFSSLLQSEYYLSVKENSVDIYVSFEEKWWLIWKWGENIRLLEQELHMRISVKTIDELPVWNSIAAIQPHRMFAKKKKFRYK